MATQSPPAAITRAQVRRTIKSKRGAMAELARTLNLPLAHVSQVLAGRGKSQRVMDAAHAIAESLLNEAK